MKTNLRQFCTAMLAVTVLAISQVWGESYRVTNLSPGSYDCQASGVSGSQQVGANDGRALLWNGSADSCVDLTPSGFGISVAYATNGTQQVGYGVTSGPRHALLWNSSAASYVDLNPSSGIYFSEAHGISGTQQVGWGHTRTIDYEDHALLWNGSAASCVDLNPSGFYASNAYGTNGTQQVGYAVAVGSNAHAMLWSGSAASYVDLNRYGSGYSAYSVARGIYGTQQVGEGASSSGITHAMLWSGTAESCVDLNPSGFDYSSAYGTNGTQQVGYGYGSATGGNGHALLWSSSADSFIDLHQFLPTGFVSSGANAIDSYGNIVGYAYDSSGYGCAILWEPIPEPASAAIMTLAGLFIALKRKQR